MILFQFWAKRAYKFASWDEESPKRTTTRIQCAALLCADAAVGEFYGGDEMLNKNSNKHCSPCL